MLNPELMRCFNIHTPCSTRPFNSTTTGIAILIRCIFLFLIISGIAGAQSTEYTPEQQKALYEAQQAMEKKDYSKAVEILNQYTREHPETPHPMVYYALGNAQYMKGDVKKAYGTYAEGHALSPDSYPLCINLAKAAYELEHWMEAGDLLSKAYTLSPTPNPELLYQASGAYYNAKAFDKAKTALQPAMNTGKASDRLRLMLHILLEQKNWKEAESMLMRYLKDNPLDAEYWKLLGRIRLQKDDYRGAAAAFEILYAIQAPTSEELKTLSNIYLTIDLPAKALALLKKAYGEHPMADEYYTLYQVAASAHMTEAALSFLDSAAAVESSPKYCIEKGKLLYNEGGWKDAVEVLNRCLETFPDNLTMHYYLGLSAVETEDFETAKKALTQAAQGGPHQKGAKAMLSFINDRENTD